MVATIAGDARVREARALAQLSHPNVVGVLDVGVQDDRVFVAMELVEGQTLRAWFARRRRQTDRPLLARRPQGLHGGRAGLAAAHARDLVHRDFKPDNVMITAAGDGTAGDPTGRIKVLDFGLARGLETLSDVCSDDDEPSAVPESLAAQLTRTGALVGTPASKTGADADFEQ
jgi:serine/threonine protein kinase